MPTHPIFESVKQHLQQGETGAALQTMITYLEAEGKQTDLLRTLRVVQANYNAAKQQELKGILAFQEAQREYPKVNDALLSTIDDLSAGRPSHTRVAPEAGKRLPWIIGGAAFVLVLLGSLFYFRSKVNAPAAAVAESQCPVFRPEAEYKIMLLPFVPLSEDVAKPALSIQMRIRDLTRTNNISADVQIAPGHNISNGLPDFARAEEKGKQCGADLIVWGQYEKNQDSILVDVHYVFLKGSQIITGHTDFHPFKTLSALQKSGKSSGLRSLDDAVLSLCSIMAVHAGRAEVAEKWLGKIADTSEKDDSLIMAINKTKELKKVPKTLRKKLQERQN